MTVRDRFLGWLDRGPDRGDPDEFVELTTVPLRSGPFLIARLQRAGIEAVGDESFEPDGGPRASYRVMVRRRDVQAALAVGQDSPA